MSYGEGCIWNIKNCLTDAQKKWKYASVQPIIVKTIDIYVSFTHTKMTDNSSEGIASLSFSSGSKMMF